MSEKIANMRRSDPAVKKTLVRHSVQRLTSPDRSDARLGPPEPVRRVRPCTLSKKSSTASLRQRVKDSVAKYGEGDTRSSGRKVEAKLDEPTLCSSLALHKYIEQVKISQPPPLDSDNLGIEAKIAEKMTKRLNFPFNEAIYKDLIELNASTSRSTRRERTASRVKPTKRDLEPKMEDFFPEEGYEDEAMELPSVPLRSKPVVSSLDPVELCKVIQSFDYL